jgi:CheY-like chemotaxis protein
MMRVLLIDDVRVPEYIQDPDNGVHPDYKNYSEGNHEITIARSGEEGVILLGKNEYDVLLLDHDMGTYNMTGMGVIRYLEDNLDRIPKRVYLVTANSVMGPIMLEHLQRWFKDGRIERYEWITCW